MALKKLVFTFAYVLSSFVDGIVHPDGVSKVSHYQDDDGNFNFGYTVTSNDGEHFHKASKDVLGRVVGSYGLTQLDGRHRIVDYVADENGFRANIRSNEPGLANSKSSDIIVDKAGDSIIGHGLDFAATGESRANYGDRLRDTSSSVTYARPEEDETHRSARRPLFSEAERSPQTHRISIARPVVIENQHKPVIPDERSVLRNSEIHSPARYRPPIDPYSSIRRPAVPTPLQPIGRYPLDSQVPQPSTPPYGGFETRNPLLDPALFGAYPQRTRNSPRDVVPRYPVVTMSTIHGGVGGMPFLLDPLPPRIPNVIPPSYPQASPNFREYPVSQPRDRAFLDPSRRPNLVLRAIAIPNGIRAVHVDPTTGEIYNTPEQLVRVPYNNDFDDDEDDENDEDVGNFRSVNNRFLRSQFPINRALLNRSPIFPRFDSSSQRNYSYSHRDNDNNIPNEASLSRPSAKDLYFISRVFDEVNQNENDRHPRVGSPSRNLPPLHESRPDYPREATYHSNADRSEFDVENNRDEHPRFNRQRPRSRYSQNDEQPYESSKSVLTLSDTEKPADESTS